MFSQIRLRELRVGARGEDDGRSGRAGARPRLRGAEFLTRGQDVQSRQGG